MNSFNIRGSRLGWNGGAAEFTCKDAGSWDASWMLDTEINLKPMFELSI